MRVPHTQTRAHARTHARTHTHTHIHTHTHTHTYAQHTHTPTHTHVRAHARARAHARTHASTHARTHAHTHTQFTETDREARRHQPKALSPAGHVRRLAPGLFETNTTPGAHPPLLPCSMRWSHSSREITGGKVKENLIMQQHKKSKCSNDLYSLDNTGLLHSHLPYVTVTNIWVTHTHTHHKQLTSYNFTTQWLHKFYHVP